MSVITNSDDERYANESFESPSENDMLEMSDTSSEIEYDDACDSDAESDAKSSIKQLQPANKYPGSFRLHKTELEERVNGGGKSLLERSSSSSTENDIENANHNDDDDNDVVMKKQSLSNFSTLSMNFDTSSAALSDRSAPKFPVSRSQRNQRGHRTQRSQRSQRNQYVYRKKSLNNFIEQNENSEYCTDDDDYEKIKQMEKFYRRSLQIEQKSLSAKKQHSSRSNNNVVKKSPKKTSNESGNSGKNEIGQASELEQELEQEDTNIKECAASGIEKEITESITAQKSITESKKGNDKMTPKESDIISASRMLQPMENFFDQLKLPSSDDVAKSLINAVRSTILKQTTSLAALQHNDEKLSRATPRKSKSYASNREKCYTTEENQKQQLEKHADNDIGDHCKKEDQLNEGRDKNDKMEREQNQLKRIEEGYVSCESFGALVHYSEQMPSFSSVSTDCTFQPNNFNSDDCLYKKTRSKGSQKAPIHDTHKLPPHPRKSWSFTNDRMREIERHNHILLRKILSQKPTNKQMQSKYGSKMHQEQQRSLVNCAARVTSSSLNRKKQQRQIDFENRILQRKLEAISLRRPELP